MKKYSKKGLEKRKQDREGYSEFYQKHVSIIKSSKACCLECGNRLIGDVSEVAHVLEKSYFKSLALDDDNIIYLCSWKSRNNCHATFDNSNVKLQSMNIFEQIKIKVQNLLDKATEKINYSIYNRWQI